MVSTMLASTRATASPMLIAPAACRQTATTTVSAVAASANTASETNKTSWLRASSLIVARRLPSQA